MRTLMTVNKLVRNLNFLKFATVDLISDNNSPEMKDVLKNFQFQEDTETRMGILRG